MAITKIREIRNTLDKAISYICNPEKTKGMLLVDSFHCVPETAAAQMELTASFGTRLGNRKAYHLIQSFNPDDDITPERALEIGKQYADLVTSGKYEYVIATHNDGKHIHNHIIFNAVSFEEYRKYHHGKKDVQRIMDLSDRLCRENNLSVIERTSGRKGKNYEECQSGSSWREHLANLIDAAVLESQSFEDFLEKLEMEGVTVKLGKHISFRCELLGQERACRGKTIGSGYTEEAIRARLSRDEKYLSEHHLQSPEEMRKRRSADIEAKSTEAGRNKRIHALNDTWKAIESGKRNSYINKIQKSNIGEFVKFTNFMQQYNLKDAKDLMIQEDKLRKEIWNLQSNLEKISTEMDMKGEKDETWIIGQQRIISEKKDLLRDTETARTIYEQTYGDIDTLQELSIGNFIKFTNFMQKHELKNADDLLAFEKSQKEDITITQNMLNQKISERKVLQRTYESIQTYFKYKARYDEYKKTGKNAEFRDVYGKEIDAYLTAQAFLKSAGVTPSKSTLKNILHEKLIPLNNEIKQLRTNTYLLKEELQKTVTVRAIYEKTYGVKLEVYDESQLKETHKNQDSPQL